MGLYIALYVMYMLSEGGRYDSWIALLFLNAGRGSLHLLCLLLPLSAFLLSHFSGLWRRSCVGTGAVNILSLCWVARLQRKMNNQGKGIVKGRGSAELFGDPERSSSQTEGIIFGEGGVCVHVEWNVGSPCCPDTSRVSGQLQPERWQRRE